ncbi:hypothetical protein O6H91_07G024400 [Diphasiastrum complanatum]|uniref:Uncharacterized protein n=1 Tax=Diphasiastrum complanatum TaxID=34168 RepID=A0ACC2D453_DIPCM|nr:hypothetical protein O6H91_07G024400 [Diphasiastrum complanatum]
MDPLEKLLTDSDISECNELAAFKVESKIANFFSYALRNVVHLFNRMPTGTLLAYNILQSASADNASCDIFTKLKTGSLLGFWGMASFILAFTDSYRAPNGDVYFGLATPTGMWTPQIRLSPKESAPYKITAVDFVHATLSVLVFAVSSVSSDDVVYCFFPYLPQIIVKSSPALTSLISALIFIFYPSNRHGINYPTTMSR